MLNFFTCCKISGTETLSHVLQMTEERTPKVLLFSQLQEDARNEHSSLFRYKDKLKCNLMSHNVPLTSFHVLPADHGKWRRVCHEGITNIGPFSWSTTNIRSNLPSDPVVCNNFGLMCKSAAWQKCHLRHKNKALI